ncbi:MAG: histidine kinase [Pseudomonadota bacterium]|nr:histidine kinase [Pseudomonadota bacterium]
MSLAEYRLDLALPAEVVTRNAGGLMSYRNFPVFSVNWLKRRSLLFGLIFGVFFALVLIGMLTSSGDVLLSVSLGLLTFAAFMFMACAGPAIATWVRHRHWSQRRERIGVVLGLLAGIALSYGIDVSVSDRVEKKFLEPRMKAAGVLTDDMIAQRLATRTPALRAVNLLMLTGIYGLLGGGLALRAYFSEKQRWLESERERELVELRGQQQASELRLGVLQAQIEPHFLFNTLASLRALVRQDPARAEATIDALVDHLRATIPKLRGSLGSLESTLAQQFEICRSYLALMQVRMGERLSFSADLPSELRAAAFPPLMLISLVENAIKHGIEPKPGRGEIRLSATRVVTAAGALVRVEVADTGAGLQAVTSSGIGLENIRDQLRTRYRGRGQLDIQGAVGGGTLATITVPESPA